MKIGIITQPLHTNYGGLLQNFALQLVLKDMGHSPITLDWESKRLPYHKVLVSKAQLWLKRILHKNVVTSSGYQPTNRELAIITKNTDCFINSYIKRTHKSYTTEDLSKEVINNNVQALIAGSDQVWRPLYSGIGITNMFFGFISDPTIKRIAYAASFGTDNWEYSNELTEECKRLVKSFDLVSVREESGVQLCQEHFGIKAKHVLDPTLLLEKKCYETLVNRADIPKSVGNLFYYILDPTKEKTSFIEDAGKKCGLVPFTVMPSYQAENRTRMHVKHEIEKCIFPSVEEWLKGFMDAKMVICDSFHGCVFSIIFNKPFWVIRNEERGNSRFDSLLKTFKLEDRLISHLDNVNFDRLIDWGNVNSIIKEKREYSLTVLMDAIAC